MKLPESLLSRIACAVLAAGATACGSSESPSAPGGHEASPRGNAPATHEGAPVESTLVVRPDQVSPTPANAPAKEATSAAPSVPDSPPTADENTEQEPVEEIQEFNPFADGCPLCGIG